MGRAIFISYRRDDTEGEAGRLFDDLVRSFGDDSVFMDVSDIQPGVDFRKEIDANVASCGVLLAIIGPTWTSISGENGRRLDDPNDFVRLEIASALARNVAVIPVLVHDAKMPRPDELPEALRDLAFRNSVEVTHARWNSDVQLLTQALARYVAPTASTDTTPVHATVAVQLPPPTAPAGKQPSTRPSSVPLVAGIIVAAVLALGVIAFLFFRNNPPTAAPPVPKPVTNDSSAFLGTWSNSAAVRDNGLVRLDVSAGDGQTVSMHAWGQCGQSQCDWGTQPAKVIGPQAQATWQFGAGTAGQTPKRTALVTIEPRNGQLSVTVANTYSDHSSNQHQFMFAKGQ
jgi:TIR domain